MKRQCVEAAGVPDYPTFRDFRKNRRDFLKSFGMGVAGLTLASCAGREPEILHTGGQIPVPDPPEKGGKTKVPSDVSPPGTPPALDGVPVSPKQTVDPPPLGGKPVAPRLGGDIAVPAPPQ